MLKKIEAAVSFSLKIGSHYLVFCLWLQAALAMAMAASIIQSSPLSFNSNNGTLSFSLY
jgi:hypothetical protein